MPKIMIYGATGFTGTLISRNARSSGLNMVLAGRDEVKLKKLSELTNYEYIAFSLDNQDVIEKSISDVAIVLNVAGPFIDGLELLIKSCIKCKKHFIDLAMDPQVLETYDNDAKRNGVMVLSGIGAAFLPLDCLGGFMFEKMTDAKRIAIYISGWNTMSRGTAKSNMALVKYGIYHRKNGEPFKIKKMKYHSMTIDNSNRVFAPSSFGVSILGYSTGIADIETYFEVTPAIRQFTFVIKYFSWLFGSKLMQNFLQKSMDRICGPTQEQMDSGKNEYYCVIENGKGEKLTAKLITPEAYKTTWLATLKSLESIGKKINPGFQTPYKLFGHEMINMIEEFKVDYYG